MSLDMNETELTTTDNGVSISKLLEIIGKQQVEWMIEQESIIKVKEQFETMAKQLSTAKAELAASKVPVAPPLELEQLQKINEANDIRIAQLEKQVHDVALERDAAFAQVKASKIDLEKCAVERDALQKQVNTLTVTKKKK